MSADYVCSACYGPTDGDDTRPTACCLALHRVAAWPIVVVERFVCEPACECGAPVHPDETHEEALQADAARCTPGCTCPGYPGAPSGVHDGLCDLFDGDAESPMTAVVVDLMACGFNVTSEGGVFVVERP